MGSSSRAWRRSGTRTTRLLNAPRDGAHRPRRTGPGHILSERLWLPFCENTAAASCLLLAVPVVGNRCPPGSRVVPHPGAQAVRPYPHGCMQGARWWDRDVPWSTRPRCGAEISRFARNDRGRWPTSAHVSRLRAGFVWRSPASLAPGGQTRNPDFGHDRTDNLSISSHLIRLLPRRGHPATARHNRSHQPSGDRNGPNQHLPQLYP
jgi:hypothetical protein